MKSIRVAVVFVCTVMVAISGCTAGARSMSKVAPVTQESASTLDSAQNTQEYAQDPAAPADEPKLIPAEVVPEAEVTKLLEAAHSHAYTMTWEVTGGPDPKGYGNEALYRTWGRTGVMPNGDRYVLLGYDGFLHKGNQAWYLKNGKDGITNDPPETGGLKQRPGIQLWEGIKPDQLGVLDGIWRNSGAFKRVKTGNDTEQWISTVPSRQSSLELFRSYRDIVDFWVTVRRIDQSYLPVRFHLTWWDAKVISFDGMYDWNPPTFPQVTGAASK